MPDEGGIADLKNDLLPVYTHSVIGRGATREVVAEVLRLRRQEADQLEKLSTAGCGDCRYLAGTYCRHWQDKVPDDVKANGCDDWQYSGMPF